MSDDWDTVTKIGSKVRGTGASVRETTIKGKSALNAAARSGAIVGTEKKYSSANATGNQEGQRLTKVDRSEDIIPTTKVDDESAKALSTARSAMKNAKGTTMTQKDLAAKCNVDVASIAALERTGAEKPSMDIIQKVQKGANVRLTGKNIGEPFLGPKKKAVEKK